MFNLMILLNSENPTEKFPRALMILLDENLKNLALCSSAFRVLPACEAGAEIFDERALLLALIGVEAEAGRNFSEGERAAIDKLEDRVEGYDADDLAQAVKHLVTAKPRKERELEWPDLKQKLREIRSSEK